MTSPIKPGLKYTEREGVFVPDPAPAVLGSNQKYQGFYDKIAWAYDLWEIVYAGLTHGGRDNARAELLEPLTVKPGARVLEISIGTGVNLRYLPAEAEYHGLDISWKMLQTARRKLPGWKRSATLYHGIAEDLPFCDASFDVVYHIGGINFFTEPAKAVAEMIRVAKPGATVMYGDETEKLIREGYAKTPVAAKYYREHVGKDPQPLTWLPAGITAEYKVILKGNFYLVVFTKP